MANRCHAARISLLWRPNFFQSREDLRHSRPVGGVAAGVGQANDAVRVDDKVAAKLVRITAFAKSFPFLQNRFRVVQKIGRTPRTENGRLQTVSMVSGAFGVDQKGEGGLGFLQPHLRPVGRAKRNRDHVSAGGVNFCLV